MNFATRFFTHKSVKILFAFLVVGIILILVPYVISKEQCPASYSQQQISTSDCIVGADIVSGMIWLLGVFVAASAIIGLCAMLIGTIYSHLTRLAVGLVMAGMTFTILGIVTAPLLNSSEIYKSARCSANDRLNGEYCEFPKRSPQAEIDYSNNKVMVGGALLLGGLAVSGFSMLRRRSV